MTTKVKIIIIVSVAIVSFAFGRFTTPTKTVIQTKTVEVEKKTDDTQVNNNDHKITTITSRPDGTTVTVIKDDDSTQTSQKDTDNTASQSDTTKTVTKQSGITSISVLAGVNVTNPGNGMLYGAAVSHTILGPISIGIFGISSGIGGASVGVSF